MNPIPNTQGRENVEIVVRNDTGEYTHLDSSKNTLDVKFETSTRILTIKEFIYNPDTKENLLVIANLGQDISQFVSLEELTDGSLLLSLLISDSTRIKIRQFHYGYTAKDMSSELASALKSQHVAGIQILLPTVHIPRRWTPSLILATYGKISTRQCEHMLRLRERLEECCERIRSYESLISGRYTIDRTHAVDAAAQEMLSRGRDAIDRPDWVNFCREGINEMALMEERDKWRMKRQRLQAEYLEIVDFIKVNTRAVEATPSGLDEGKGVMS